MTKTIFKLWRGELEPVRYSERRSTEVKQLEKMKCVKRGNIEKQLDETMKSLFENYSELENKYSCALMEQAFYDGFCLGTKLTAEALIGAEED